MDDMFLFQRLSIKSLSKGPIFIECNFLIPGESECLFYPSSEWNKYDQAAYIKK